MNTIQLQYVGKVPAKPANELKIGSKLMWNGGSIFEVISIEFSKTGKTLNIIEKGSDGREWNRKLRSDRLVVIVE